MSEARNDTAEARLAADAAQGAQPAGRHRGSASSEDGNGEAAGAAHGRHRRPGVAVQEA
jgi:hypothetical protein